MNLTEIEREELRQLLSQPLIQKALQLALSDVLVSYSGASTMESAALSYKAEEGARALVSTLFSIADIKKVPAPTHRRFRPETTPQHT